jgi:uncharacterized repeat protein (TIGR01451 family)
VTEPADTLPPLRDAAYTWDEPTFQLNGVDEPGADRSVAFTVQGPQENPADSLTAIGVTNNITRTAGSFTVSKSSDPVSGSTVLPGSTITYTVTVNSTGNVPVHDVLVTDDLSGVVPFATVDPASLVPGTGTAAIGSDGTQLVWTAGDLPPGTTQTLTYQATVNAGAVGATIRNAVTATGDGDPAGCAPADSSCSTTHSTPLPATVVKDALGTVANTSTGVTTVLYRVTVTNPNAGSAVPYTLTDAIGFPTEVAIRSALLTRWPADVTLADPSWDGQGNTLIVTDATVPAAGTHVYLMAVVADVPAGLPADELACDAAIGSGRGLFNGVTIESLGVQGRADACAAIPPPNAPNPPLPPNPPIPPYPPLPNTGFAAVEFFWWAFALIAAGAAVLMAVRRRRPDRASREPV